MTTELSWCYITKLHNRASENRPSWHTKIDHVFQLCCITHNFSFSYIITTKFIPIMHTFRKNLSKVTEVQYLVQKHGYSLLQDYVDVFCANLVGLRWPSHH